ncbi:hypothetical protein BCR44DRAFT_1248878 [Catenaria anguillulae PL171]|uniref:Uncharacterized protein n=1 Tax=Catenaria anguillulae PL171 TaxID=765915 RepID=A0A1Y2I0J7_9FUNG|nr:hypothetical protein BCR44DRAFT_1248878 [Catenaria anguillulae PL171]
MAPTQASAARRGSAIAMNPAMRTIQSQSRPAAVSGGSAAPHTPLATIKSGTAPSATPAATPAPHADISLTQFLITVSSSNFSQRFHAFDSAALNLLPSALPLSAGDIKLIDAHVKHGLTSTHPKPLGAALLNMAIMVERGVISGTCLAKVVATAAALKYTGEYACRPTIMDPVHRILEGIAASIAVDDVAHVVAARSEVSAGASLAVKALVAALVAQIMERVGVVDAARVVVKDENVRKSVIENTLKLIGDAGDDENVQKVLAQWVWVLEKGT